MKAQTRKQFLATAVTLAAAPAAVWAASETNKASMQVIHHVFFWLKRPGNAEDRALLIEGLRTLRAIPQVKTLLIGGPASTVKRDVVDNSFDLSEMMFFDSAADQDAYQVHPVHAAFVEKYGHLMGRVVVYDMIVEE